MNKNLKNSLCCMLTAFLAVACNNEHTVYHSYLPLPNDGWDKSDTLCFHISISDSVPTSYRLYTEVRNKTHYPYHNLHLIISQNFPDSTSWKNDTLTFQLADSVGKWTGKGWGGLYQSEKLVTPIHSTHAGQYIVKIVSGMKDASLPGLNNIGIRIDRQ